MRLLRLMGGAPDDVLRCEIDVVDIEDDLTYEAVSYVWGLGLRHWGICHTYESPAYTVNRS